MYADVSGARIGPDRSKLHTECLNINECLNEDLNTCGDHGACIDTIGSYHCVCNLGYTGDLICRDIDECLDKSHACDSLSICRNTEGTYECSCINGFESIGGVTGVTGGGIDAGGDGASGTLGVQCVDTNECTSLTPPCVGPQWFCTNTVGSYECTCHLGYTKRGENCEDIDECSKGNISNRFRFKPVNVDLF